MNEETLPAGWTTEYLGNLDVKIFDGPFGSHLKTNDYVESGIRVIRLENIGHGRFVDEKRSFISEEKYNVIRKHTVVPGDIVFSSFVTESIRSALIPPYIPFAVNKADCFGVRFLGRTTSAKFVQFFLQSRNAFKQIEEMIHGVGRPRINTSQLKEIVVPIAPKLEQVRIVTKIEELFSELDKGVEALTAAHEQLKAYRQSVLRQAFEGELTAEWRTQTGEVEWTDVALRTIGHIETGNTPSTQETAFYHGDVPFFKPTDLDAGYYVKEARNHLSREGLQVARSFPANSILVTCIGATIGKTGFARVAGACNQQINSIVPASGIHPAFIYFQIIGPAFQEQIKTRASSTTLPIINKSKFSELRFVLCSPKEQEHLVSIIEHRLSISEALGEEISAQLGRLEALRQSILKQAFSGQLVAQNQKDEPASVLLERIRFEEQGATTKKPRTTKNGKKKVA